jgi:hypothetical protein
MTAPATTDADLIFTVTATNPSDMDTHPSALKPNRLTSPNRRPAEQAAAT